jgi:hypothetical protein
MCSQLLLDQSETKQEIKNEEICVSIITMGMHRDADNFGDLMAANEG